MEFKDYYATLGVSKTASADEIQKAYRKLARKYHPDINKEAAAEARFKDIGEAYEVLKDPEKRQRYDNFGADWSRTGQGPTGNPPPGWEHIFDLGGQGFGFGGATSGGAAAGDFSSFFESLFGSAGPRSRRAAGRPGKGRDVEASLSLSLEEAARGGAREVTLRDPQTGARQTLSVNLPAGVKPGQRVRLAGKGDPGAGGGPAGDLLLKVQVPPHARFRLDGNHLHTTVEVTPWEAALGAPVEISTLDSKVRVKIPRGSSSGRKIRLAGKGFPSKNGTAGDLFAELSIVVPNADELTEKEAELLEELGRISSFTPRGA
ncbi:MAG: DnaJ C-terminal domain-containing protein [Acidobacteriota bacterium]